MPNLTLAKITTVTDIFPPAHMSTEVHLETLHISTRFEKKVYEFPIDFPETGFS